MSIWTEASRSRRRREGGKEGGRERERKGGGEVEIQNITYSLERIKWDLGEIPRGNINFISNILFCLYKIKQTG